MNNKKKYRVTMKDDKALPVEKKDRWDDVLVKRY